jgi:predicted SnoaL-like aldol condensation-catalyzing enzyme
MLDAMRTQQGAALRTSLEALYRTLFRNPECLPDYLANTCVQHVGRVALSYADIVKHVSHVKSAVQKIEYTVVDAIAHGDTIADRHIVELTLHDGRSAGLEVLCFLHIANGKVAELYESSQVLHGDQALGALAIATE